MCGLFGFSTYGHDPIRDPSKLTNSLALQSSVRGTDATGIAFIHAGKVNVQKEALPAHKLTFKPPSEIKALIGHTRHSTQGSEKKNYNNHPFTGKVPGARFALAHNGVLTNDDLLRIQLNLPKTKIETDSYVAVQLIELKRSLTFASLRYMAEQVQGSFSFSILGDDDSIYLVKGDSPLSLIHFPHHKTYVYASTDEILYRALIDTPLFEAVKSKDYQAIPITCGTILRIRPDGHMETDSFHYSTYRGMGWWDFGDYSYGTRASQGEKSATDPEREAYIENLKLFAYYEGVMPEIVDELLNEGFTLNEIEEYIYEYSCC